MAGDTNRLSFSYDANSVLKDSYSQTASGVWKLNGSNKLLDVGDGVYAAWAMITVTSLETDSSNEVYTLIIQGGARGTGSTRDAPVIDTTTVVNLAELELGYSSAKNGSNGFTSPAGVYKLPFRNVTLNTSGVDTTYPIIRGYTKIGGTIGSTGLVCDVWLGKMVG
jgi:sulfur transfer complex TusBCD TusB component (DsrH family)